MKPEGFTRATSCTIPSIPTTGVGLIEEPIRPLTVPDELYSDTLPPVTGIPNSTQPSASAVMAVTSCHMASVSSGLPKFRQSVMATGSAPTTQTLR